MFTYSSETKTNAKKKISRLDYHYLDINTCTYLYFKSRTFLSSISLFFSLSTPYTTNIIIENLPATCGKDEIGNMAGIVSIGYYRKR